LGVNLWGKVRAIVDKCVARAAASLAYF